MCGPVKCADFYTFSTPRLGRHKTVITPEISDQIHELICEDRKISFKSLGEQLRISLDRVEFLIHEYLYMRNLREMSTEMRESGKKMNSASRLSKFGNFLSGAIGDHVRNLVVPL